MDVKMRPINCELNTLTRSDGSAMFSQGESSIVAAIIGPVEAKLQGLKSEKACVECVFRPKSGLPNINDKLKESIIRNTCETVLLTALHPRTTISIQLQELDDRCGLEACAINAACMALISAGVPMQFTVAAVHCIVDKNNELLLDPDHCQAIGSCASFIFVFDSSKRNLVTCHTRGRFSIEQCNEAEELCRVGSEVIFSFYRKIIAKTKKKSFE